MDSIATIEKIVDNEPRINKKKYFGCLATTLLCKPQLNHLSPT